MAKIIFGLTGQSGAGKSTVATIFKKNGFFLIDADAVARTVVDNSNVLQKIKELFGDGVATSIGTLNRKALAKIVFSDKTKLQLLNELLFPIIRGEIKSIIDDCDEKYILLDAPQLFESNANAMCDKIISVVAPHDVLILRIMKRDGITKEDAEKRLSVQFSEHFFIDNSDFVICNNGTTEDLIEITEKIIQIAHEK